MKNKCQQYQQDTINRIKFNFKSFLFLFILCVNFCFSGVKIFGQEKGVNANGWNVFYYENGVKSSEGNLVNGEPDGYWRTYYENGFLKSEGNRLQFKLDSIWKFYNSAGKIYQSTTYLQGLKHGSELTFDSLQRIVKEVNYNNSVLAGVAKEFYASGNVKKTIPYDKGKINGLWYEYSDDDGRIITIRDYTTGFLRSEEILNRYDELGEKHGVWREFYENGKIKWEGEYIHGKLNGVIKTYTSKGGLDKMEKFDNGNEVENAKELVFLDFKREIKHDGSMLVGAYEEGKKQGIFRQYDANGNLIKTFKYNEGVATEEGLVDSSGLNIGPWIYYYDSGEIKAKGVFAGGKKTGEWLYYYKNGKLSQKGKYVEGLPHAEWKWWFESGTVHREEYFIRGKLDGEMIEYDSAGIVIVRGEFIDGLENGKWFYHVNDHTEEGAFSDGEKHGVWEFRYENAKTMFVGEYLNGQPIGKHKYYYPNGMIKWEGKYESGLKEDIWTKYSETGEEILSILYKNGIEYKIDGSKIKPPLNIQ